MNQPLLSSAPRHLPYSFARRHGVLLRNGELWFTGTLTPALFAEAKRFAGTSLHCREVDAEAFQSALAEIYQQQNSDRMQMGEGLEEQLNLASLVESALETQDLLEQAEDAPIVRLINALLLEAIKENASDIHIEPFEKRLVVRFRIDGVLREMMEPPRALAPLLVSRIKVMAKLDIAEKRLPQDGRIALKVGGREVDVRVSTIPASSGERVVLRLLDKQKGRLDLSHLGMEGDDVARLMEIIRKPHGIVLVTGPTGSGKTTSLYAALSYLNDRTRNILTVEDPIEYQLEGIGQMQVNTKVDMTFARGLRSILRQDPDVVMVGEIRDLETAEIAVQASLTGHLVLSTLHTNSAVGAVTRLADMGVEPFLLSSSLVGLIAQRLVRRLCESCKQPYHADAAECDWLGWREREAPALYRAAGCPNCKGTGYRGRTGIYEIIAVDEEMRSLIHANAGEQALESQARRFSASMREDGVRKILAGMTTIEEVLRVVQEG